MIHIYITYADLRASKGEGKSWKKKADHAEMLRSLLGGSAGCSKAMGGYLTATWLPLRWEACYAYVCIYVIPTKLVDFDRVGRFAFHSTYLHRCRPGYVRPWARFMLRI